MFGTEVGDVPLKHGVFTSLEQNQIGIIPKINKGNYNGHMISKNHQSYQEIGQIVEYIPRVGATGKFILKQGRTTTWYGLLHTHTGTLHIRTLEQCQNLFHNRYNTTYLMTWAHYVYIVTCFTVFAGIAELPKIIPTQSIQQGNIWSCHWPPNNSTTALLLWLWYVLV